MVSVLFLQPPSPPGMDVTRDYAGGFGIAVSSPRNTYGHYQWTIPHVSLMYSAGILKSRGHDIDYVDAQAERLNAEATIARIRQSEPKIVIAVVSLPSLSGDGRFLRRLRSKCAGTTVICLGTVCRVLPDDLASVNLADILVLDEAECVVPSLVDTLLDDGDIHGVDGIGVVHDGELHRTKRLDEMVDLKTLSWPPYEMMPTSRYYDMFFGANTNCLPVWSSRGCSMPCSYYCPYPIGMGKRIRIRPSEDFVNEISHLHREFGISSFILRDQIFSSSPRRAGRICDMIVDQKLRIRWLCETRFDMVDRELLKKMMKAGCKEVHFGLETGDSDLLREIGKPGMELSEVGKVIKMVKAVGITPLTHVIVGLPGETSRTIKNTLRTVRELGITRLNVNIATPYPGTPMFRYAEDAGLLETKDWSRYTSFKSVMKAESMTTVEIERQAEQLARDFLGSTFGAKIRYLCRNRGVMHYISSVSRHFLHRPSLLSRFLQSCLSTHDVSRTLARLDQL